MSAAPVMARAWRAIVRSRVHVLFPALIVLLAAGLRFHRLEAQSLWNDEGNSLRLAERPIAALVEAASRDIHPPGYYLALKSWIGLAGSSEFGLRAFSALAGVLAVAFTFAAGKALSSPGAGALAALLVAISPFSVYYGQEARMYALLQAESAASLWLFIVWLGKPSPPAPLPHGEGSQRVRIALALALVNAAGLYTQYAFPFVMLVEGALFVVWWLSQRAPRRPLLAFAALNLLTLALFLPQLPTALRQVTAWPQAGRSVDLGEGLAAAARWLVYGNTYGDPGAAVPGWLYLWPALFLAAGLLPDWIKGKALPSWWRRLLPLSALVGMLALFFALNLFREANLKFLLPVQVALALGIGRGIWLLWEIGAPNLSVPLEALPRLAAIFGALSMLGQIGGALGNLYGHPAYQRDDYRRMAAHIMAGEQPGDAVILDAPNQIEAFSYYYRGNATVVGLPRGLGGDDAATERETLDLIARHPRLFALYWGETERDPNRVVERTLAANTFEAASGWYGDVRLVQYAALPSAGQAEPVGEQFGESIVLDSVAVSSKMLRPGQALGVALTWRALEPIPRRYRVTVQLLGANGRLLAQHDAEPGNNMALTTTWQPGQPVPDAHGLLIPPDAPPGDYSLVIALYDVDDPTARLPVAGGDALPVASMRVE
ncbi:MAG: glycosyltransferase family 39 protein [Anaerolineae bacterium]|nr:glycosyltransferase family 39 protein [Anaerolineae bacterium]